MKSNLTENIPASVSRLVENMRSIISIDPKKLEYIVAAMISGGHVILADSHGVGKTSLAKALAGCIDWGKKSSPLMDHFTRIQCTVDLLPQDILGYNRLNSDKIVFNKGPIFSHFVLCDEINLLTPKTQGSFFQAMEEQSVSIEGKTFKLEPPFFIISTMNLKGVHLFPLPAPQLDRFMIQISLGYPDAETEIEIVKRHGRDDSWNNYGPVVGAKDILAWKDAVDEVPIHDDIVSYIVNLVRATRTHPDVAVPGSPRSGIKLSRMARALTLLRGEDFVSPETVKEIFFPVMNHRLTLHDSTLSIEKIISNILSSVPVESKGRRLKRR
ncbi:MAG TPA: MoxR family ATPase [Treponemataceae bacterium]|jgi:MoxR-like ATPase|nr:MoxR family ATPase [Treponemataceae bacterium]